LQTLSTYCPECSTVLGSWKP